MVAVIADIPGGNKQVYERVVNVVPSQEGFETFARERLLPAAQRLGGLTPELTFFPCTS